MIRRLVCKLLGHRWTKTSGSFPASIDRDAIDVTTFTTRYRCERCGKRVTA